MDSALRVLKQKLRKAFRVKTVKINGIRVLTDTNFVTKEIRNALYKERYEAPELRLVDKHIEKGDRVLEIGAGIGLVSVACARICGTENLVSYEANQSLERIIRKNFKLNGLTPNLRMKAVGAEAGEITFFQNDNIFSSSLYDRNFGGERTVPCDAVETVIADLKPNVLLVDAEGAEVDLLPLIDFNGINKLIIELHPHIVGEEKIDALIDSLKKSGFREIEEIHQSYYFEK